MDRRSFMGTGTAMGLSTLLPTVSLAYSSFDPKPGGWRSFELVTRLEILRPQGTVRAWVPVPSIESEYQRVIANSWTGNAAGARLVRDGKYGAAMLFAEWPEGERAPVIEISSRFATRNRAQDLGEKDPAIALDAATARFYTRATDLIPTDGMVRKTALSIVRGRKSELDKARALYDWIVDNTFRDPKTRGCGTGDIRAMLETGNLGGKCADLNALYVGLARSLGLPARDVYGLRVAKSAFGYRSLGIGTENATRAQHCRAEVFLTGLGWLPVDPADVRKVVLEERAQPTTLSDPVVPPVREKLFGAWEMNWVAYNDAADVKLPGSDGASASFLMYPQAETGAGRVDSLDPDGFRYRITSRELSA